MRVLVRTVGGLWSALMMVLMAASLTLTVLMSIVPGVLNAVAGSIEAVTGVRSVVTEGRLREERLVQDGQLREQQLQAESYAREQKLLREGRIREDKLINELSLSRQQASAATSRADSLQRELATRQVSYRGQNISAREAVKDASDRISQRTATAAARNVGSTFAEALPVIGVAVIVAATAWELKDSCDLMREMRDLDAAFNPDDPVDPDEVCGMTPPTRAEIWAAVLASPGAIWSAAGKTYDSLPSLDLPKAYGWTVSKLSGFTKLFDDEPEVAAQ